MQLELRRRRSYL